MTESYLQEQITNYLTRSSSLETNLVHSQLIMQHSISHNC